MRTFRRYNYIFVAGTAAIVLTLLLFQYLGPNYELVLWQLKKEWASKKIDADYIIIGSSATLALDPEHIKGWCGKKGINLSVTNGSVVYTYYQMKKIAENKFKGKIYIELVPYQLTEEELRLNKALGERFIKWYADKEIIDELSESCPGARAYYNSLNYARFFYPVSKVPEYSLLALRGYGNSYIRNSVEKCGGCYILGDMSLDFSARNKRFDFSNHTESFYTPLSPIAVYYFKKLKQLINENNLDVKFFLSPISQSRIKFLSKTNHEFKITTPVLKEMEHYGLRGQPVFDDTFFVDPRHLTYEGSIKYDTYFYQCVMYDKCDGWNILNLGQLYE